MINKIKKTLEMIKFSHSIFALPFALSSLLFASYGYPKINDLVLIIICMILARNVAMSFNRLVDAKFDAANPRTKNRHLPEGSISKKFVITFIIINSALFILTSHYFNQITFYLSPLALFIICFYSLTKRFTHYTQLFLGLALGISPLAVWIALTGTISWMPVYIGVGVFFWVAGFDLIYATADYNHDIKFGIKSMIAKYGIKQGLNLSKGFHFLCVMSFLGLGIHYNLSFIYFITICVVGLFLAIEQSLVKEDNLAKLDQAFFTMNSAVGIIYLAGVFMEVRY